MNTEVKSIVDGELDEQQETLGETPIVLVELGQMSKDTHGSWFGTTFDYGIGAYPG